MDCMHISEIM
ncbi:hypothetical protein F383_21444 [Gossypium arboreum]|uniref:Uncharacterized protein n=1 Tax=Gossypium arboreum TaxID=29729 RepID=A0A0B0NUQ0_GOSAR|nr:hypothetical protein F383_21444 [Gossypium arboreum]